MDEPGTITVHVAVFASSNRSDIGGGCSAHWSEAEAIEAIRNEVISHEADGGFSDATDEEWEERQAEINRMTLGQLISLYEEQSGDNYLQTCWVEQHTLVRPPDLSDPGNIEKFLQEA